MTTQQQATFTADQSKALKDAAISFAQSEVMGDEAVKTVATLMGTDPSYVLWGLARSQFITDYMTARKCNESAASEAWQRMARRMRTDFGLEKPTAPSVKAAKVAESRAKKDKAIKAAIAKHKTEAMLNRAAGEALEEGKTEQADILRAAAKAAAKAEVKAKMETQKLRWEKIVERLREARKAHDARILEAIEKAIETLVPVKGTKSK